MKSKLFAAQPAALNRLVGVLSLLLLSVSSAFAAEGEGVRLSFSSQDNLVLIISAVLGLVGVGVAFSMRSSILKEDAGSEGMRDVQKAIEDGALAYLRQQIRMMIPFIIVLAIGLVGLYWGGLKAEAGLVAVAFILGVASSYAAGFTGMMMAVKANARVAHAALTSNKKALETAFKSGAVAGLMTVGIGLFASALILIVFPKVATVMLVGYGFGGSLAALFMRVGGGIFTKAADVGADLVGKVEQSIPEDSPMNPATIADNVGDNVGDCAGMAADVFESFEVMLVATIVLGAATATVLDAQTWPKLIVFALAACGVGIIASILGIQTVKGSDDLDSDPLKPILGGFRISALVGTIGIALLSVLLLKDVKVQEIATGQYAQIKLVKKIVEARDEIASEKKINKDAVSETDLKNHPKVKALGLSTQEETAYLPQIIKAPEDVLKRALNEQKALEGYREVTQAEFDSNSLPALNYALQNPPGKEDKYISLGEKFNPKSSQLVAVKVRLKQEIPAQNGQPAQNSDMSRWFGPQTKVQLDDYLKAQSEQMKAQKGKFEATPDLTKIIPVKLYYNAREDKFALVSSVGVDRPDQMGPATMEAPPAFHRKSPTEMAEINKKIKANPTDASLQVPAVQIDNAAALIAADAPWWKFAFAVAFGIFMAIAIEFLTNYYVAANKRPTKEVAGLASAGPAPMLIQGFAYGCESSVFMVLAIVFALLVPLWLFPAAVYGSMILAFYGMALVGLGLLMTTGYILAMDTFGPISDNAQGVFEMSGSGDNEYGSTSLQRLDAAGNTTKALTKGFAIATAVVAAVALFQSFIESSHLETTGLRLDVPEIFFGLLIGAAAPFLFSAFAINAVGRSAFELISEVRRQFRENPGILKGEMKPDYGRCVEIVTAAAQRELLGPGILAICLPIAVGFGFSLLGSPVDVGNASYNLKGAQALGGFLAGAIASGQLMAVLLSNSGGMWDNAKKIIEDGYLGGKGTEAHKAAVVCDTVGDPFKDTAGPALNPLIKVMNLVALLVVGVVVQASLPTVWRLLITIVSVALLVFAFMRSKKGSLAEQMQHLND
jgi:K(+)-stimulated pyrophosphate-energized sodium pump